MLKVPFLPEAPRVTGLRFASSSVATLLVLNTARTSVMDRSLCLQRDRDGRRRFATGWCDWRSRFRGSSLENLSPRDVVLADTRLASRGDASRSVSIGYHAA